MTEADPHIPPGPSSSATDRLCRARHGRMVAGVAAGVADYLDVDVSLVRVALVALAFVGVGIPMYAAAWLLIPEEDAPSSVAEDWIEQVRDHGFLHGGFPHGHTHEGHGVAL